MNPIKTRWQHVSHGTDSPALKMNTPSRDHHPALPVGRALFYFVAFFSLLVMLLSAGCASSPKDKGFSNEKLLVAAGFKFKEVNTPEQLEKLKKLPQEKLIHHELEGEPVYLYASADGCRCLYAGGEEAYERLKDLRREAKLNSQMHKGIWAQGDPFTAGEDWASYINDLDSGMIPGY